MVIEAVEGICEGEIALEKRGECGFGYDPIFVPLGYNQTFAELGAEIKNKISHRAKALKIMMKLIRS
jgi:XTP/dITP diphosphohydrolase